MLAVQVYLCDVRSNGAVRTTVLRSIKEVCTRASDIALGGSSVLVHVGASRPSDEEVTRVLSHWDSAVLLTASARWSFTDARVKDIVEICQIKVRGCTSPAPVYLALSGWGYTREAPENHRVDVAAPSEQMRPVSVDHYPGLEADDSFWQNVKGYESEVRAQLLAARDESIRHALRAASVQAIAMSAPKWFRDVRTKDLSVRVRTKNCLQSLGADGPIIVADFVGWPDEKLMRIRWFGRASLADLRKTMLGALLAGPAEHLATNCLCAGDRQSLEFRWSACREAISSESASMPLGELSLGVRSSRILQSEGIQTVGDLSQLDAYDLLSFDTFGQNSLRDVVEVVEALVGSGRATPEVDAESAQRVNSQASVAPVGLYKNLARTLARLPADHRRVIEGRLGAAGQPRTLVAIGEDIGLSKERVRQIERKQIRAIVDDELWDDELRERLHRLLHSRTSPLPLVVLSALDGWFEGFEDNVDFLCGVIHAFGEGEFCCWDLDGTGRIVTRISYEEWMQMHRRACDLIDHAHGGELHVGDVHEYAEMVARSSNAQDLVSALSDWLLSNAVLEGDPDDSRTRVLSRTKHASDLCLSVLNDSDTPLHYSEVKQRIEERVGHQVQERRIHGALARDCLLYGRGTYGLLKHLAVDRDHAVQLRTEVREIVEAGAPGRQWHSQELLDTLRETGVLTNDSVSPYELSIILHQEEGLEYLGRQVWMCAQDDTAGNSRRMIADLVEDAIREAGGPLTSEEVWRAVSEKRGISRYRLVPESQRVIRVSRGTFGLIDRDLGLSQGELQLWAKTVESKMDRDGSVSSADVDSLQSEMQVPALQSVGADVLIRVAAKMHGWRVTRDNYLVRAPVGLLP
jgi:hypothetical protein